MSITASERSTDHGAPTTDYDTLVVGAGFAGLGTLRNLRDEHGLRVHVLEAGSDVGGTWYWNRYPGARTDSESWYYCYSFSRELYEEWDWRERYPSQPEMYRYFRHVADKFDLRKDISFDTRVVSARWDDDAKYWTLTTHTGTQLTAKYFVSAMGFFSAPNIPPFPGRDSFRGRSVVTSDWPKEGVELAGKRVGLIGTGATGVQLVPVLAEQVESLTVFQRTPNYVVPAHNHELSAEQRDELKRNFEETWSKVRGHSFAMALDATAGRLGAEAPEHELQEVFEYGWNQGGFRFLFETYDDMLTDFAVNEAAAEFVRQKIRSIVKDPETAELLAPKGYPFAGKRPPAGHGYYEAYNNPNVRLVDVSDKPITEITPTGLRTEGEEFKFDVLIYATGFDAVTGGLTTIDVIGRNGTTISEEWRDGPRTFLGLGLPGFPNLFVISGPQSPFANLPACIEGNIEFISQAISHMASQGVRAMEAKPEARDEWTAISLETSDALVTREGKNANSWYAGANVEGKPRVVSVFFGGANNYLDRCEAEVKGGFPGFTLTP